MKNIILTSSLSAAGTIRQLFRKIKPNRKTLVFGSYDDYSHGPLSTFGTSHDFSLERQAYWKSFELYDVDILYDFDLTDEYISMVIAIKVAKNAEIWITSSVQDLFYTTVILHLLTEDKVDTAGISIRYFGGEQVKWGLGAINVEELEVLFRSSMSDPFDPKFYSDAWKAISQSNGLAIKSFIEEQDQSNPMVAALSAYLLRFPDFNGGLGSIERSLLGAGTDELKKSAYTVGNAMAFGEPEADHIGDLLLFKRLVELSSVTPDPWFKMEGDPRRMRSSSAQITESGKEARARYSVQALQAR
jgi:hypothetical protein